MDNVATLRNTYGADLVSLFVENPQYCGLAWVGPSADYAYSVVNRGCASGNYSFAHELAHNFGALHDPYVDPSTSPYAYGHGLTDPAEGWRTVMAYNNACAAAGTSCVRIPFFSNPSLTYGSPANAAWHDVDVRQHPRPQRQRVGGREFPGLGGGRHLHLCASRRRPSSVGAGSASASFTVTSAIGLRLEHDHQRFLAVDRIGIGNVRQWHPLLRRVGECGPRTQRNDRALAVRRSPSIRRAAAPMRSARPARRSLRPVARRASRSRRAPVARGPRPAARAG